MKFEQMNLIRPILRAIREVGYTEPTPIQQKTVPPVLLGKDVLGCAQTGTGKTAAFALPILQHVARAEDFDEKGARPIRALILTPTRELALQIHENFTQYGKYLPLRCAVIFGGVNQNPQIEQLRGGVDILVATPGRLNDLIGQGHITLRDIRIFVLDEADRMLDMGFIHDVKKVMTKLPERRQTLLFSATMPPQVEEIAAQLLTDPVNVKISPVTSTVDSVEQSVYYVDKQNKTDLLLYLLNGHGVANALVFTRTKHGADAVARKLTKNGVKAMAIHGDKSQNARVTALNRFKSGEIDVLVATDIAARGIDIVELPTVINYNVPEEPETYIHRIGRTGRAGMEGVAITFCCSDELENFRDIEKMIRKTVEERRCEWSVVDMQPTKPEPRGQNSHKRGAAEEKPEQTQKKPQNKPQNKPAQEKPATQKAAQQQARKETSVKEKRSDPPKSKPQKPGDKPQQKSQQKPRQNSQQKPQEKPITVKTSKVQETVAEKPMPKAKSQAEKKQAVAEHKQGRGEQSRRSASDVRRPAPERVKPKAEPNADRRYADSGEHDGATGQQIVTNFNRSVWLEFNDPPKRNQKPWLIHAQLAVAPKEEAPAKESGAAQSSVTDKQSSAKEEKGKVGGVFHRWRRDKKRERS